MSMARVQKLVQLDETHVAALDQRAAKLKRSRSDLIREAVEQYLADDLEAEIDRRMVEGYRRIPPPEHDPWTEATARRMIEEEPW